MDIQQQLNEFRLWAMDYHGPTQKWMWSALALLAGYLIGLIIARVLSFMANKLAGLRHHKRGETTEKTADHVMVDILGALIRAANDEAKIYVTANG